MKRVGVVCTTHVIHSIPNSHICCHFTCILHVSTIPSSSKGSSPIFKNSQEKNFLLFFCRPPQWTNVINVRRSDMLVIWIKLCLQNIKPLVISWYISNIQTLLIENLPFILTSLKFNYQYFIYLLYSSKPFDCNGTCCISDHLLWSTTRRHKMYWIENILTEIQ